MKPFSLIIPVYNEENILENNFRTLKEYCDSLETPYEIIFISNGSTDNTNKIGIELQNQYQHVKFLSIPEKGIGRAFKKGIPESAYEHIIFIDADLAVELPFIKISNQLLEHYVIVLGAKIKGLQNRGIIRKFGSFTFYLAVLFIIGLTYVDYAPGAKAYQKNFLLKYFKYIDDFTNFVLNLTFIASKKNELIIEMPINCEDNRKSRFNLLNEAFIKYWGLFSLKFRYMFNKI